MPAMRVPSARWCQRLCFPVIMLVLLSMVAHPAEASVAPNPVRRVINMLQMMQKKVEEEGANKQKLFDKFMCYCRKNLNKMNYDISGGKNYVPVLEGLIQEEVAEKGALHSDIADAKTEFDEADTTLTEATSLRTKENKEFTTTDAQMKVDLEGLGKAAHILTHDASLLQTETTVIATIRRLSAASVDMSSSDRDIMTGFLSETESAQDSDGVSATSPSEILGILKAMIDNMKKDREQINSDEKNANTQFDSLKTAKVTQMTTLRSEMATKIEREGAVGLQIVEDEGKLGDIRKTLIASTKLYDTLDKQCKDRQTEFDAQTQTASEEMMAISDTIQLLNDDMAKQLMKKTMVAPAFLQIQVSPKQLRKDALKTFQKALPAGKRDPRMGFVALALRSGKATFTKVLGMINDMITLLNKEQQADKEKKEFCVSEIDKTEDEKKELDQTISDLKTSVINSKQKSKGFSADILSRSSSIKALDQQVADAGKQRKEENEDFQENLAANNAAVDILTIAKTRLGKFYSKAAKEGDKLLQLAAKPTRQVVGKALLIKSLRPTKTSGSVAPLSQKGQASISDLFDTDDGNDAVSFVQLQSHSTAFAEATAKGNKIVELITSIVADIDKEVKEMTKEEKDAQFEYEQSLKECAEKRAGDAKAVSQLEGYKAEVEAELHKMTGSVKAKTKESEDKALYVADLRKECDWLVDNYKTRTSARAGEIDALRKAKAVLSGADADADFLQLSIKTWKGLRPVEKHI